MDVEELIKLLGEFKPDTKVEVMTGGDFIGVRTVAGDDDEGVYLELEE